MYKIVFTRHFKHGVKRCAKRSLDLTKLSYVVDQLRDSGCLPEAYHPHKLSGYQHNNTWECHIESDWLLVWEQDNNQKIMLLLDTGTHSDIF
mgnify:CR=1 FL=1